jgi:hypothetical protein
MTTTQTTLIPSDPDDETTNDDLPTTDDSHTRATPTESANPVTLASADQRGGERSCPWCLAAPETFDHREDGHARCGYCDAAIPVGAEWYERGEKIVI